MSDEGSNLVRLFKQILNMDQMYPLETVDAEIDPETDDVVDDRVGVDDEESCEFRRADQIEKECNVAFEEVDTEINGLKRDAGFLQFNSIETSSDWIIDNYNNEEADSGELNGNVSDDDYDLTKGNPVRSLVINLGSSDLPRFSCGNHKLNIGIKRAIKNHSHIKSVLRKLNRFLFTLFS